jgi:hypothetical protein
MRWRYGMVLGLGLGIAGSGYAQAQRAELGVPQAVETLPGQNAGSVQDQGSGKPEKIPAPSPDAPAPDMSAPAEGDGAAAPAPLGPTPLNKVGILQNFLFGPDGDKAKWQFSGWFDSDYTYRSSGPGQNNIAPVMNRFGDEYLFRQLGLYITRPLDPKDWSWGFNSIFIAGSDAAFLGPSAGGWANTNPRFGAQWTDLNVTAHMPILTEGGVDVKIGRQTTILGPMGALPWQRPFTSSDYAWYNMEEGRYTGVSSIWHINKWLHWYNGLEFGGWGVFFDMPVHSVDYITNLTYWLDEDAKDTKVWTTLLTGPTGHFSSGSTTVLELGASHNWNEYVYQILDTQMVWSHAPVFAAVPPGYNERAYDVYTVLGVHINKCVDVNTRFEIYWDIDGGGYPGGFGIPHNTYFEMTYGINYHPTKWLQFRPEVRYDHATHPAFGRDESYRSQLSVAFELFLLF